MNKTIKKKKQQNLNEPLFCYVNFKILKNINNSYRRKIGEQKKFYNKQHNIKSLSNSNQIKKFES